MDKQALKTQLQGELGQIKVITDSFYHIVQKINEDANNIDLKIKNASALFQSDHHLLSLQLNQIIKTQLNSPCLKSVTQIKNLANRLTNFENSIIKQKKDNQKQNTALTYLILLHALSSLSVIMTIIIKTI